MSPNLRVMTFIQLSAPSDEEGGSLKKKKKVLGVL